ncbi:D-aminoacyl-tRNA deacylase [Anopheles ziemanni]|uniref:D-aminoacyl-tRNA deacylase n=1 Tax=Anopheles ziemanni TaxID=345580 RepID=UPI00265A50BD|nr:D-aminoacyl-tRNA deacylase isoform X1 [Anopheles coustani]XP_058174559.1 D-aminoacyl-tRNA deacylase [Anopheles ziemanni]
MKAIIQRVTAAKVTVGDELVSSIGRGLCVLVGISTDDNANDVDWLARKLLNIRLFEEPSTGKRWMESVVDQQLEILCVSQFTLYHRMKGNRPDFSRAMQGADAQQLYGTLLQKLRDQYAPERIQDGRFGAMMQVHIQNDGPVTLEIESPAQSEQERQKLPRAQDHKAKVANKQAVKAEPNPDNQPGRIDKLTLGD